MAATERFDFDMIKGCWKRFSERNRK